MVSPREALVVLNLIPGLGSVRIQSLLEAFGSAELALSAPVNMLRQVPRIGDGLAGTIADWRNCTNIDRELRLAEECGVRIVTLIDEDYPEALRGMADPPVVLYTMGEWIPDDGRRGVAVVGTRLASPRGVTFARRFARELADSGCTIISGLARGIDTAAHWGALDSEGRTIAVLGSGLCELFPKENEELARRIADGHGAVVSEFPMTMRPNRSSFPQRNRLVAAWSRATLVIESAQHGGAIITARLAAELGRSVFALPGDIDNELAAGCNQLIRDGAILCTCPQEILDDLDWKDTPKQLELLESSAETGSDSADCRPAPIPESYRSLADAIKRGNDTLDALCAALGQGAYELTPLLMRMQVEGFLVPLPGGRYALAKKR